MQLYFVAKFGKATGQPEILVGLEDATTIEIYSAAFRQFFSWAREVEASPYQLQYIKLKVG